MWEYWRKAEKGTISAARMISTLRVDDILRGAQDDIRRGAADLELQADGELEDRVDAEALGEAEEIAAFAADGGVNLLIGCIADGEPSRVLADEVAFVGAAELAAAHVVDAEVERVVERISVDEGIGVADTDVGL